MIDFETLITLSKQKEPTVCVVQNFREWYYPRTLLKAFVHKFKRLDTDLSFAPAGSECMDLRIEFRAPGAKGNYLLRSIGPNVRKSKKLNSFRPADEGEIFRVSID